MPRLVVTRSIEIAAPVEKVLPLIRDFREWPRWSPWLVAEPETQLQFADDGKYYRWEGTVTGTGEVRMTEETDRELSMDLTFIKPFPAKNRTGFQWEATAEGTRVTWSMEGSLPFFMFFMVKSMEAYVGGDFMRGLMMLKDCAEWGRVPSRVEFLGVQSFTGADYVGRRQRCAIAEIGPNASEDARVLNAWVASRNLKVTGSPLMICERWDMVRGQCEYTMAVQVDPGPDPLPEGFFQGELPPCRTYDVRHTGAYRHLANAWTSGVMHSRAGRFKMKRGIAPFESYENDPREVAEEETITVIHFPAR
ncbi:hypothetical protein HNR46_003323 [Haloferula luteola]|uniref:GyrI-like small molecule binding domain-containing protein n=1 Tax=Haloferula luteola TaxID=595692 RepID=A0A840VGW3_9BACT|nr:SRPBCC family protein [Haloferula luteola]MBB5353070.1 hypothetical protein [Haloferula luteola]